MAKSTHNYFIPRYLVESLVKDTKRLNEDIMEVGYWHDGNVCCDYLFGDIECVTDAVRDIEKCNVDKSYRYIVSNDIVDYLIDRSGRLEISVNHISNLCKYDIHCESMLIIYTLLVKVVDRIKRCETKSIEEE